MCLCRCCVVCRFVKSKMYSMPSRSALKSPRQEGRGREAEGALTLPTGLTKCGHLVGRSSVAWRIMNKQLQLAQCNSFVLLLMIKEMGGTRLLRTLQMFISQGFWDALPNVCVVTEEYFTTVLYMIYSVAYDNIWIDTLAVQGPALTLSKEIMWTQWPLQFLMQTLAHEYVYSVSVSSTKSSFWVNEKWVCPVDLSYSVFTYGNCTWASTFSTCFLKICTLGEIY